MFEKNKDIEKNYKKKIKLLNHHNKLYHNEDSPIISDVEYDKLKKDIIFLEKKYEFLKTHSSSLNKVGSPPSNKFKKIKH